MIGEKEKPRNEPRSICYCSFISDGLGLVDLDVKSSQEWEKSRVWMCESSARKMSR